MSYAVLHMEKFKRADVKGIENHNKRKGQLKNDLIDSERSELNYDLMNQQGSLLKAIDGLISQERKGERAVRKDAVVLCNFVVSSDKKFFDGLSQAEQHAFFQKSTEFFIKRYPERVISAVVHMDESTPHMHLGVVPITQDGRLSAKEIFDRAELRSLQTDFALEVGAEFGLERGREGSKAKHLDELSYRAEKAQEAILEAKVELSTLNETINAKNALYGDFKGFVDKTLEEPKRGWKSVKMSPQEYDSLTLTVIQAKKTVHDLKQTNLDLEVELQNTQKQRDELFRVIDVNLLRENKSLKHALTTEQAKVFERNQDVKELRERQVWLEKDNARQNEQHQKTIKQLEREIEATHQEWGAERKQFEETLGVMERFIDNAIYHFKKIAPKLADKLQEVFPNLFEDYEKRQLERQKQREQDLKPHSPEEKKLSVSEFVEQELKRYEQLKKGRLEQDEKPKNNRHIEDELEL